MSLFTLSSTHMQVVTKICRFRRKRENRQMPTFRGARKQSQVCALYEGTRSEMVRVDKGNVWVRPALRSWGVRRAAQ